MNPAAPVTAYRMGGAYRAPLLESVDLGVADQIEAGVVGDDGRVLPVRVAPELVSGDGVQPVGAALQRREVDAPRHDRRRPRDLAVRLEGPFDVARRGVVAVEGAVVGA